MKIYVEFLSGVPDDRKINISFEQMARNPEKVMKILCSKFGLKYQKAMINRRQGDRMTRGMLKNNQFIGDPNFANHTSIEPALADAWKKHKDKLKLLRPETIDLALKFGYEVH